MRCVGWRCGRVTRRRLLRRAGGVLGCAHDGSGKIIQKQAEERNENSMLRKFWRRGESQLARNIYTGYGHGRDLVQLYRVKFEDRDVPTRYRRILKGQSG